MSLTIPHPPTASDEAHVAAAVRRIEDILPDRTAPAPRRNGTAAAPASTSPAIIASGAFGLDFDPVDRATMTYRCSLTDKTVAALLTQGLPRIQIGESLRFILPHVRAWLANRFGAGSAAGYGA